MQFKQKIMRQIISLSIVSIAFDTAEMRRMNRALRSLQQRKMEFYSPHHRLKKQNNKLKFWLVGSAKALILFLFHKILKPSTICDCAIMLHNLTKKTIAPPPPPPLPKPLFFLLTNSNETRSLGSEVALCIIT